MHLQPVHPKIRRIVDHERRHAGATLRSSDLDTVDQDLSDAGECGNRLGDFGRRHILAFPAKRIADPIDEIEITLRVPAHQIARSKPGIALRESAAQNFPLVGGRFGIALEAARRARGVVENAADRFADLARRAFDAAAGGIAKRFLRKDVEADELDDEFVFHPGRNAPDRTALRVEIDQHDIAFGRGVEFENAARREARCKGSPDVRTQAVAATEPDLMRAIMRARRRRQGDSGTFRRYRKTACTDTRRCRTRIHALKSFRG